MIVYSGNGTPLGNKNAPGIHITRMSITNSILIERSQTAKSAHTIIPFTWTFIKCRQTYSDESRSFHFEGSGVEEGTDYVSAWENSLRERKCCVSWLQ